MTTTNPQNASPSQPTDNRPSVMADALKQKLQEAHDMVTQSLKVFAFYLAITGALFKFALDANSTPRLAAVLTLMGLLTSAVGIAAAWLSSRLRGHILGDIAALQNALNLPVTLQSTFVAVKYIERLGIAFAVGVSVGWVFLLLANSNPKSFALYRSSGSDPTMRIQVAIFDGAGELADNRENCEIAKGSFAAQHPGATQYSCELVQTGK